MKGHPECLRLWPWELAPERYRMLAPGRWVVKVPRQLRKNCPAFLSYPTQSELLEEQPFGFTVVRTCSRGLGEAILFHLANGDGVWIFE